MIRRTSIGRIYSVSVFLTNKKGRLNVSQSEFLFHFLKYDTSIVRMKNFDDRIRAETTLRQKLGTHLNRL